MEIHSTCSEETRHPVPDRPDLIEIRCPHYLYPLRYERREVGSAAR